MNMTRCRQFGFTLLEVLISILVLTIAFFALLSTEITAIQGYTSARDYTRAAEVARMSAEALHIEASTWRGQGLLLTANQPWGTSVGVDTPFDNGLVQIANNGWGTWTPLTTNPVDERLGRSPNVPGERFCVLARGDYMELDSQGLNNFNAGGVFAGSPIFQVQLVVVYAGPTADPLTACDQIDNTLLVADDPDALEDLEIDGHRALFFGTVILRKDWA